MEGAALLPIGPPAPTLVTKVCTRCGKPRPRTEFYTKGSRTDSQCKSCILKKKSACYRRNQQAKNKIKRPHQNTIDLNSLEVVESPYSPSAGTSGALEMALSDLLSEAIMARKDDGR